jgi:hypothetical protein
MGEIGNAASALGSLVSVALLGVLAFDRAPKNWLLEYYPNAAHAGTPTRAWVRRAELAAHDTLLDAVPDREDFTMRLETCLTVSHPLDLGAELKAAAHGQLYVDGKLVFDSTEGPRPADRKKKKSRRGHGKPADKDEQRIALEPGVHAIELDYLNRQGAASFSLALSAKGSQLESDLRRPELDGTCAALSLTGKPRCVIIRCSPGASSS